MLEDFLNKTAENKDKKLSKTNTKAFNAVKQRLKKNNREWEEQIRKFRESGAVPGEDLFDEAEGESSGVDEEQKGETDEESWDDSGVESSEDLEEKPPTSGGKPTLLFLVGTVVGSKGLFLGSQWLLKTGRKSSQAAVSQKEKKKSKSQAVQQQSTQR